jgi:uncharacterized protein YbbK (DUF523 family)
MIFVSACLLGHRTKYDGDSNPDNLLIRYNERGHFIAACPECSGQLPIPRPPVELQGGDGEAVLAGNAAARNADDKDFTRYFVHGARQILNTIQAYNIQVAILKENSPSCGVHQIYDGSFTRTKKQGTGVCTALLQRHGVKVYSEKDITPELLDRLLAEDEPEN